MKTIDVLHLPKSLWLGRRGENNFRPVAIGWGEWHTEYPEATLSVIYHRPDGQDFIVATGTTSPLVWIPQQDTTTVSGIGELEMHLVDDPEIGISAHVDTIIDDSRSNASTADAPAWADKVVQDVSEAASHYPQIIDGYWWVWDVDDGEWVNTNVRASGGDIDPTDIAEAVEDYMEDHPLVETDPTVSAWAKQPTKPTYTAAEVHALSDTTVIPDAVTEQTVSGWGFTKNTGTYSKPNTGIPATDLASDVQTSLGKADTALQTAPVASVNNKTGAVVLKTSDLQNDSGFQTEPFEIPITLSGSTYTTTATAEEILENKDNCVAVVNGQPIMLGTVIRPSGTITMLIFSLTTVDDTVKSPEIDVLQISVTVNNGTVSVTVGSTQIRQLPSVTAADNGKFLRVVSGAWAAAQYAPTTPRVAMTASDTTPTLDPNKLYVFPEMATLTPTLNTPSDATIVNEYHFVFDSGSTATVLTLPASVLQPDGFTVEANMHYEISILEGAMTAQGWAVTA